MNCRLRLVPLAPVLLALMVALGSGRARAGEEPVSGVRPPVLKLGRMDLLPLDDIQKQDFQKQHGVLVYRIQTLDKEATTTQAAWSARKQKDDEEGRKLQARVKSLRAQVAGLQARLSSELAAYGVDGPLIATMNKAPSGPGRIERYAHGLVLLVPDLALAPYAIFQRIIAQMQGAWFALTAQQERMKLALEQTTLESDTVTQVMRTFDRQLSLLDQRFWQLVDFTLTREQRAWIWRRLPTKLKRKAQPVEHLYALPGLTPEQGVRLKALLTEVEHESSPDQAAVKRLTAAVRSQETPAADRAGLQKELTATYARLGELQRYAARETRAILNDEQWLDYEAIPPRLSTNDRRAEMRRVLEGFEPDAEQATRIKALSDALRREERALRQRTQEIRKGGADYGPDSPQMMGMQMEMASVAAQGQVSQRDLMGRIFLEVLKPEQVSRWVMGHWGIKR